MVIAEVGLDIHPVLEFLKVKVADPALTAVTTPSLVTLAINESLLSHVPPIFGDNVVVCPTQIVVAPVILTVGFAFTVTAAVALAKHPALFVNVKVAVPAPTPVTTPALVTVATELLLLDHVPPDVGETVVASPIQITFPPVNEAEIGLHVISESSSSFNAVPLAYPTILIFVVFGGVVPSNGVIA